MGFVVAFIGLFLVNIVSMALMRSVPEIVFATIVVVGFVMFIGGLVRELCQDKAINWCRG